MWNMNNILKQWQMIPHTLLSRKSYSMCSVIIVVKSIMFLWINSVMQQVKRRSQLTHKYVSKPGQLRFK